MAGITPAQARRESQKAKRLRTLEILTRLRDHIVEGNIPDGGRVPSAAPTLADVAERAGATVTRVERPWGEVFTVADLEPILARAKPKVVGIVMAEMDVRKMGYAGHPRSTNRGGAGFRTRRGRNANRERSAAHIGTGRIARRRAR